MLGFCFSFSYRPFLKFPTLLPAAGMRLEHSVSIKRSSGESGKHREEESERQTGHQARNNPKGTDMCNVTHGYQSELRAWCAPHALTARADSTRPVLFQFNIQQFSVNKALSNGLYKQKRFSSYYCWCRLNKFIISFYCLGVSCFFFSFYEKKKKHLWWSVKQVWRL